MRHFLRLSVIFWLLFRLPALAQEPCRSVEYKQATLLNSPGLAIKFQEIENFTQKQVKRPSVVVNGGGHTSQPLTTINIPVVVHIVYNNSSQNISDAQIQSQIAVLNRDYRKLNADTSKVPSYYSGLAANCGIRFVLANVDTNGRSTTGIVRRQTNKQYFSYDDAIKFTAKGGDDGWDRDRYLNIWVGHFTEGVLGYSSAPGCEKQKDGVAIDFTAFGTMGTAAAPFNLGRTATHEIGHWLNLIHIWGDASCGNDDVDDTPQQGAATRGNPSGMVFSCGNTPYGNLYMDFMDFTDDVGMHLFTFGQRDRMRSLFAEGGVRNVLLSSKGIAPGTPLDDAPAGEVVTGDGIKIQLYPNPAFNMVQVSSTEILPAGAELEVYNQTGGRILTTRMQGGAFQLDVSSLSAGLYFVVIKGAAHKMPTKLIKM
jgi:hypothetical protein